jgi:hypothetical protein
LTKVPREKSTVEPINTGERQELSQAEFQPQLARANMPHRSSRLPVAAFDLAAAGTPVLHLCREIQRRLSGYANGGVGSCRRVCELSTTPVNHRICLCTAGVRGSNPLGSTLKMEDLQVKRLGCAEVRVSFVASSTQVVSRGLVRSCRTEQSTVRLTLPGLGFVCSSPRTAEIAGSIPALPIRKCLQMVNKRKHPVHAPITSYSNTGSVEELRQWKSSRGWRKWSKTLRQ